VVSERRDETRRVGEARVLVRTAALSEMESRRERGERVHGGNEQG
jgi:hypothetical protein